MGLIYQIECLETGLVYIGQTKKTLKQRFGQHKCNFITGKNHTHSIFEVLKNGFAFPSIIEILEDDNKLCERERYFIQNTDCVNDRNRFFNNKEYYEANKEKKKRISERIL